MNSQDKFMAEPTPAEQVVFQGLAGHRTADHVPIRVLLIGRGSLDITRGKSQNILQMLGELGADVYYHDLADVDQEVIRKRYQQDWELLGCDEMTTLVVDSLSQLMPEPTLVVKPERHGPRAVTTGKGRSRFDRQNRWR